MITVLLILQLFHVLFLALHDWVPLDNLNDVESVRKANPINTLLLTTLISTIPFVFGLAASLFYLGSSYPGWLRTWLWISYTLLFVGEINTWWIPYLFGEAPEFVDRYEVMFGRTHAFLPVRHGIRPNTLHVILHLATLATLVVLGLTS